MCRKVTCHCRKVQSSTIPTYTCWFYALHVEKALHCIQHEQFPLTIKRKIGLCLVVFVSFNNLDIVAHFYIYAAHLVSLPVEQLRVECFDSTSFLSQF